MIFTTNITLSDSVTKPDYYYYYHYYYYYCCGEPLLLARGPGCIYAADIGKYLQSQYTAMEYGPEQSTSSSVSICQEGYASGSCQRIPTWQNGITRSTQVVDYAALQSKLTNMSCQIARRHWKDTRSVTTISCYCWPTGSRDSSPLTVFCAWMLMVQLCSRL